jgi:hypothetical protein
MAIYIYIYHTSHFNVEYNIININKKNIITQRITTQK